ncbi:MAG: hypothetical protein IPJ55_07865 [Chloracidobacterium sp.]|nr:hypothetical protein [Chloracidobacterium sp.]
MTATITVFWLIIVLFAGVQCAKATPAISLSEDEKTVIVEDAPEMEVVAIGKSVEVRKSAREFFHLVATLL